MRETIPAWLDDVLVPMDKLEVHRKGIRHKAVSVFVCDGDKILLQRRALSKYHTPGLWTNTCCTHPEWDEEPAVCAVRRLREEMRISGLPVTHRGQVEYSADVGNGMIEHEVVDIFCAEMKATLSVTPNPAEVADIRWTGLNEVREQIARQPEMFTPWFQIYLSQHTEQIFAPGP